MRGGSALAWLFVAVWATWLGALSGHLAQFSWTGRWTPDLALALFVALAARVDASDIGVLALCFGAARAAITIDSPAAVLAAALATGALLRAARAGVQLDNPVVRGLLAALACLGQAAWLELVHRSTHAAPEAAQAALAWRAAVTSGLAAALLGPLLAALPGLRGSIGRKAWAVGASRR